MAHRNPGFRRLLGSLVLAALVAGCAGAPAKPSEPAWPDTFVSRLAAYALIQQLNAELLASRSATATLETWCGDHRLAEPARITALRIVSGEVAPSPEQRQRLQVDALAVIKYRRVQLRCGDHVLSEAENWYVPGRLEADMNRVLDTTDTPFGKVVLRLQPYRRSFAVNARWLPLPAGWEQGTRPSAATSASPLAIPPALFEHRALLFDAGHRPLAELHEIYQRGLLDFPLMPGD